MSTTKSTEQSTYTLPTDAPEANRLDTQHELFRLTFHEKLILAPLPPRPSTILDIGCGTSNWAIEVANLYQNSKVYGLDLGQPQPASLPSNYTYMVANFEKPWPFKDGEFDYIHGRFINIGMSHHKFVISEALRCLKPGGWFEMQEFSIPDSASVEPVTRYWNLYVEIASKMGRDLGAPHSWAGWLKEAGFRNVQNEIFEWPFGPWKGETDNRMVRVSELALKNYLDGLRGFTVGFFTRGLGWTGGQVDEYLVDIKNGIEENPGENVLAIYVTYGQKPMSSSA